MTRATRGPRAYPFDEAASVLGVSTSALVDLAASGEAEVSLSLPFVQMWFDLHIHWGAVDDGGTPEGVARAESRAVHRKGLDEVQSDLLEALEESGYLALGSPSADWLRLVDDTARIPFHDVRPPWIDVPPAVNYRFCERHLLDTDPCPVFMRRHLWLRAEEVQRLGQVVGAAAEQPPPYLDPSDPDFAPDLALAIEAWRAVFKRGERAPGRRGKAKPQQLVREWLEANGRAWLEQRGSFDRASTDARLAKIAYVATPARGMKPGPDPL